MAKHTSSSSLSTFELLRQELIDDISLSFEHVLNNMNKLNRSLESVIAVGHEFASVEALWSTFENVMSKDVATTPEKNASPIPNEQEIDPETDQTAQLHTKH